MIKIELSENFIKRFLVEGNVIETLKVSEGLPLGSELININFDPSSHIVSLYYQQEDETEDEVEDVIIQHITLAERKETLSKEIRGKLEGLRHGATELTLLLKAFEKEGF